MNVIFVDFDGVLVNTIDSAVAYHALFPDLPDRSTMFDQVAVGLLKHVCDLAPAKMVISSTWRIGRTVADFIAIFESCGWKDAPVIGLTGRGGAGTCRGDEIQQWLDANPVVTNYAIIDDDSDMLPSQQARFVHTPTVSGLRLKHLCHLLHIFGADRKDLEQHAFFSESKHY